MTNRAIGYVRSRSVPFDKESEDAGIRRQRDALVRYCAQHNLQLDQVYVDRSARYQYERMIKDALDEGHLCVLCTSPDRLARSTEHLMRLVDTFRQRDVQLVFVEQDTKT